MAIEMFQVSHSLGSLMRSLYSIWDAVSGSVIALSISIIVLSRASKFWAACEIHEGLLTLELVNLVIPRVAMRVTQQIKEESENPWKHHDYDGAVDDDAEENGLEDDEDFYGFEENEYVTSEAYKIYMDVLNNITGRKMLPSSSWWRNGIRTLTRMIRTTPAP